MNITDYEIAMLAAQLIPDNDKSWGEEEFEAAAKKALNRAHKLMDLTSVSVEETLKT